MKDAKDRWNRRAALANECAEEKGEDIDVADVFGTTGGLVFVPYREDMVNSCTYQNDAANAETTCSLTRSHDLAMHALDNRHNDRCRHEVAQLCFLDLF